MKNLITIILTITWLFADPPDISVSPQQINLSLPEGQSGATRSLYISNSGTDDLEWNLAIEGSTRETEWTFTNCGQTGRYGPSQSECDSTYGAGEVNVNDGIQEWTVPYTGLYHIEVFGAQGGYSTYGYTGGNGARMKGYFELTEGTTLKILVGQRGGQSNQKAAGGGGGTFVVKNDTTPLIIAGAGSGGGGNSNSNNGQPGLTGTSGGNGAYPGGTNGSGGSAGSGSGGGGGFYGNGETGYGSTHGMALLNGGNGGDDGCDNGGIGGFGGGGGGEWCSQGAPGAGGGYSGGGGTHSSGVAGGGGSYNAGANQNNESGVNEGHGQVVIYNISPDTWVSIDSTQGTVSGGSYEVVTFTFDASVLDPIDYSAIGHIYSNDPDDPEVIIPVSLTVFSEETSFMHVEEQQVARNHDVAIPIRVNASEQDNIAGMVFALSILPNGDAPGIGEELGLSVVSGFGADGTITQTGPGQASIALSGFDPPLSNDDITIAHLILPVPGEADNGDTYSLDFSGVSGTTEDYELIEMVGLQGITLNVIISPEINGLEDIYLLEGSSTALGFTVSEDDGTGTDISVALTEAPEYVSLNFTTGDTSGTIDIAPPFGAETGYVEVAATNVEPIPETASRSFFVFVNHYPVFSPAEDIYVLAGDSAFVEVSIADADEDTISMSLQSAPDYVSYTPYNETSGMVEIYVYAGAVTGDIVFAISDNGTPIADTTSGFTIIMNQSPEILGLGDFHVPENHVLDTLISFYDFNGDFISYDVLQAPDYVSWETVGNNEGILLTMAPNDTSDDGTFSLLITDPGDMSAQQDVSIFLYETFLAGDVRPHGDDLNTDGDIEDSGEFGDDLVVAPDVVNTLMVATEAPNTDVPDSLSNLFDAFDTNPIDEDANGDGDVYDETERGGDGFVEAADVIVTLKRATLVPEYPYIRRVDNEYPFSTRPDGNRHMVNRDGPDTLYFGEAEGAPGTIAQVAIWLKHNSGTPLTGLVSGFGAFLEEGEYSPEEALSFEPEAGINLFQANDGNDFVSVLLTDIPEQAEGATVLLGHLEVEIPEDMETGSSLTLTAGSASGSGPEYEFITVDGLTGVITTMLQSNVITYISGWNLVGLPLEVEDASYSNLFPESISGTLYAYDVAYVPESYLTAGEGYWLRFNNAGSTTITGTTINELTISLNEDWNLVSGISETVSIYSISDPDGIIVSGTLYGYDMAYVPSEELISGKGYWLRAYEDGEITLTSGASAKTAPRDLGLKGMANSLTVNGMDLYFGVEMSADDKLSYSLPPKPPSGAFDIRFKGDTRIMMDKAEIEVMSPYETITISYDVVLDAGEHMNWVLSTVGGEEYILEQESEIVVPFADRFTLEKRAVIPETFALHQNYPNPFNPITTLRYDLPVDSHITITIYDLNGREINQIVNTSKPAGHHSVTWNSIDSFGKPVSAGIYLYQIRTSDFVETRKMALLK